MSRWTLIFKVWGLVSQGLAAVADGKITPDEGIGLITTLGRVFGLDFVAGDVRLEMHEGDPDNLDTNELHIIVSNEFVQKLNVDVSELIEDNGE